MLSLPLSAVWADLPLQDYLEELKNVAQDPLVRALCHFHMTSYFEMKAWDTLLPREWTEFFDSRAPGEDEMFRTIGLMFSVMTDPCAETTPAAQGLSGFPMCDEPQSELPPSLYDFLCRVDRISLVRRPTAEVTHALASSDTFTRSMLLGMQPKKIHEVERFAQFVKLKATERSTSLVLDIGSGKGYLSRILAHMGLHVLAVDRVKTNTNGARRLDRQQKFQRGGSVTHVEHEISEPYLEPIVADWKQRDHLGNEQALVVGLHACGDLTPCTLRMLEANSSNVSTVAVVGCCYHMLSSFPMSAQFEGTTFTKNALMLGCQSPFTWDRRSTQSFFRRHYFRSLFEWLLHEKELLPPGFEGRTVVGSFHDSMYVDFATYANAALQRLKLAPLDTKVLLQYEEENRAELVRMSIIWSLKSLMSPVIESLVISDRALWLHEHGMRVNVQALFDFEQSPRNMVIYAERP